MTTTELAQLLNQKYGEMYQLMLAGQVTEANELLNQLVEDLGNG